MIRKETIEMLKILKEQALSSCNDTAIIDVKKDSFIFVINMAIKLLEQEPVLDKIKAEIEQLPTNTRTNWDGCCPDIDYPEIEYVDVTKAKLLEIIDKYKAESEA